MQNRLDNQGVFAYELKGQEAHAQTQTILSNLAEAVTVGIDPALKKYKKTVVKDGGDKRLSDVQFRTEIVPSVDPKREVLIVHKPFPKEAFDKQLAIWAVESQEGPVHRLADMTREQIEGSWGGIYVKSAGSYVDANRSISSPAKPKV